MPAGIPGRGSDMPPAYHSLPRPRFAALYTREPLGSGNDENEQQNLKRRGGDETKEPGGGAGIGTGAGAGNYKNAPAQKNGIQVAPVADGCGVEFAGDSEALTVTYTDNRLEKDDMVIVLLLKSSEAVTDSDKAEKVATTLTAGTIQYIDQVDVTREDHTISFDIFPQNYSNGVIRVIWAHEGKAEMATVAAVKANYKLGDVDMDGTVTTIDAFKVLRYAVFYDKQNGTIENKDYDLAMPELGNVDGDEGVTVLDAYKILRYAIQAIPY